MVPEVELWSPEQELQLLEELAETDTNAFDLDSGIADTGCRRRAEADMGRLLAVTAERTARQGAGQFPPGSWTLTPTRSISGST